MPARRSHLRPARLVAILMALLSLAVAILWVDSYRERHAETNQKGPAADAGASPAVFFIRTDPTSNIGLTYWTPSAHRSTVLIRTFQGGIDIGLITPLEKGAIRRPISKSWGPFAYEQGMMHHVVLLDGIDTSPAVIQTRDREISCPFWALFALCAVYPTIYFIRGPLRRHRRRRRGLCIECGYDLRGSADQCPECGAQMIGPRGSCAAGVAGSSHTVIDGENAASG